jgi:hypothetical protein
MTTPQEDWPVEPVEETPPAEGDIVEESGPEEDEDPPSDAVVEERDPGDRGRVRGRD